MTTADTYKDVYKKVIMMMSEKINNLEKTVDTLSDENTQLKTELAIKNAKLEVYERIANISDSKTSLGFGPPIQKD